MRIFGFDFFTKDTDIDYEVVKCDSMPSAVGMIVRGKPKLGVPFLCSGKSGYRTHTPINIREVDNDLNIVTKYLEIKLKRIK